MKRLAVITVHPAIVDAYGAFGVLAAARRQNAMDLRAIDLRDFAVDKHASVDDSPYGGGDGMVLRPEPLDAAVNHAETLFAARPLVITTSPGAKPWTQSDAERFAALDRPIAFVCGRFAGIDQRFLDTRVDHDFSLGDFVVSGGELPTLLMIDSILRNIPGVLGHAESARNDSFGAGCDGLLEHPLYTRPPVWNDIPVPPILLSGDHRRIAEWRRQQSLERTRQRRPDLLPREP